MKKEIVEKLLELIDEIVCDEKEGLTWTEKRDSILAECTEADRTNLEEFASWFATE
jgi:hypothetical protein